MSAPKDLFTPGFCRACDTLAIALQRGQGEGARRSLLGSHLRGELVGTRPYVAGDDLRDLDWAAFARTSRLFVRQYSTEEGGELLVALDRSPSMGVPSLDGESRKWHEALRAAGAFLYLGARSGLRGRVACHPDARLLDRSLERVDDFIRWIRPVAALATAPIDAPLSKGEVARAVRRRPEGPSGELVVVSDLLEDSIDLALLQGAAERGWRVTLVQVLAHEELRPPGGRLALVDAEGEGRRDVEVNEDLRGRYEAELARELEATRRRAIAAGFRHVLCDARQGILHTLRESTGASRSASAAGPTP